MIDQRETTDEAFTRIRPRLFGIAYRILGSATEAEDVLQEVWMRWNATDRSTVRDAAAFLATVTTRLAINVAQSARSRRETYVGQWLPEPVDTSSDPELGAESSEALELGILLLLERLTPIERAAYVLSKAFDLPHGRIAEMLEVSETNARQLVSRANRKLSGERRDVTAPAEHRGLLDAFLAAARTGDLAKLTNLFTADAVSYSDGGGFVSAARRPIVGNQRVVHMIVSVASWFWEGTDLTPIEVNGRPAVLLSRDGMHRAVLAIRGSSEGIFEIMWLMNPEKLAAASRTFRSTEAG